MPMPTPLPAPAPLAIHIRPFRPGDAPLLLTVFRSAVRLIACRDYSPAQIAAWAPDDIDPAAWAARMQALSPFVACLDGGEGDSAGERAEGVVGYADLQPSGYIDHFFVSGDYPAPGVGRALMQRLHAQAGTWGLQSLHADVSVTAEPFFARHGFEVMERRMPVRRGVALPNALMRKLLLRTFP